MDSDKLAAHEVVQFRFKGNRDYVHGTDQYREVARRLEATGDSDVNTVRITFHGLNRHHCFFTLGALSGKSEKPESFVAEFTANIFDRQMIGWLVPTKRPVLDRYSYDESSILEQCEIVEDSAVLHSDPGFSSIETIVAITRQLHEVLYPEVEGKWFFSRLDLDALLPTDPVPPIEISLEQKIGSRLTKSSILFGNDRIGNIFFSLVKN